MAEPIRTYPITSSFVSVPVPKSNPMNAYSIPEKYKDIPLSEIYPKNFGKEKFNKLVDFVKQHESENQHYDEQGLVKKGKANEVGIMQIQPTSDLGRGVAGPLTGIIKQVLKNKKENERIGRLHLMNLLGHTNNDIPSTIMAWNRGLPTYRKWDKAGRNFDKLPTDTKKYLEALKKYFPEPKTFVKKKEEIASTPVVEKTPPVLEIQIEKAPPPPIPKSEKEVVNLEADRTEQPYYRPYKKIFPELYDKDFSSKYGEYVDDRTLFNTATEAFIKYPEDFVSARKYFLEKLVNNPKPFIDTSMTGKPIDYSREEKKKEGGFVSA